MTGCKINCSKYTQVNVLYSEILQFSNFVNQGRNSEEDPFDEQLFVDKWDGGGGGGGTLHGFQGGPASHKWQVCHCFTLSNRVKIENLLSSKLTNVISLACLNTSATTQSRTLSGPSSPSPLSRWEKK